MTSGIPSCGGACVLPSPAPLCRPDPQHCSPTLSEAPLLRAHAQNTSAYQWASHPDHDEDWPQVQVSVTVTPTWSPVRPRQVSTYLAHGVEGGRAWPWLRRHLAGEIGRWSQPPSGPQPPHLSQGVRVGLGARGPPPRARRLRPPEAPPASRPCPRPGAARLPGRLRASSGPERARFGELGQAAGTCVRPAASPNVSKDLGRERAETAARSLPAGPGLRSHRSPSPNSRRSWLLYVGRERRPC
ncbi:lymphocyte antigen 6E isoform X1 [Symphalangus syndactylus]|uniref:lymphocyte antigen 6E isoform X1 n=1 Tax=Symphalangus syndactylus TaxID=9590 RepID=UPI002442B7AE|nr:lymphocyte antigen 6E isoform X1 [Symphalangus syndactylus]